MTIIKVGFYIVFAIGAAFILSPIISRISIGITVFRRNRFYGKRNKRLNTVPKASGALSDSALLKQLDEYLSVAEIKIPAIYMLTLCFVFVFAVFLVGYRVMPSPIHNGIIALMFGAIPLLWVWSKYQKKQLEMASVMIPTVQNFIGYFTEAENLEGAIYKSARTIPLEMATEWNRMIMELKTGESPDRALINFADRVGNDWAQYLVDILITHLETGIDVTSSLFKLINEMQNAMYNEEKRITVLTTYKWGTILMVGLSIFVVAYNISLDPKNKYYYFEDPAGIQVVTVSVVILFISFIGALQIGRKKI